MGELTTWSDEALVKHATSGSIYWISHPIAVELSRRLTNLRAAHDELLAAAKAMLIDCEDCPRYERARIGEPCSDGGPCVWHSNLRAIIEKQEGAREDAVGRR